MLFLNLWGLRVIEVIQKSFEDVSDFLTFLSNVAGNPISLYYIYYPIVYGFDAQLAIKLLHGTVFGDWLNLVMKWILMGDRPYWWIHEMNLTDKFHIRQFYNTCETGPGNPSGHLAITGIAWYILTQAITVKVANKNVTILAWSTYLIALLLLGISRIYVAAHFPHQCLFGMAFAILSGKFIDNVNLDTLTLKHYIFFTAFSLCSVFLLNFTLYVAGIDVKWTIRLATRWCAKPEWVHVSTTPYYIMWRFTGIILGIAFLKNSTIFQRLKISSLTVATKAVLAICCFLCSNLISYFARISISHPSMYLLVAFIHAFLIYFVGTAVPLCLKL